MRILIVHNRYQQRGGEDVVVAQESAMLRSRGHQVDVLAADNDHIEVAVGGIDGLRAATECVYSFGSARLIRRRTSDFRPDIAHIHNFFPTLSPSIHYALSSAGTVVVQTLHNYRLLCPASTLLRDGKPCEDCVARRVPWPAVRHKCYRGSRSASAAVAAMLVFHRQIRTWSRTVSQYIALTEFARNRFAEGGIPKEKIAIKPNFVADDPGAGSGQGGYALFVGRLAPEKGIGTLLEAWTHLPPHIKLRIVGDGPMREQVGEFTETRANVEWMPWQSRDTVHRLMKEAAVLLIPSIWYEGFPVVIAEAYASGLPVIGSRIGALAEIVADGVTGRLFSPGNSLELAHTVRTTFECPDCLSRMRRDARREFEAKYTTDRNYSALMEIYRKAIAQNPRRRSDG